MIVIKEHIATGRTIDEAIASGIAELALDRDSVSVEVVETPKKGFLGLGGTPAQVRLTYEVDLPDIAKSAPKPAPKPEFKPEPRPEPRPEPKSQPQPQAKPELKPQIKPQPRPEQKPEPKQEPKPQAKPQPRPEPKPENRPAAVPAQKQPPRPAPAPVPVSEYQPVTGTTAESFLTEVFGILGMEVGVNAFAHEELLRLELKGDSMGLLIGRRGETLDALQYLTNLVVNRGDEDYTKVTIDIENYRAKREEALVALAGKVAGKVLKNKKSITLEPMNPYERRIIHSTLQNVEGVSTASVGSEPSRRVVVSPEGQSPKSYRGRHNHHKKKPITQ